MKKTLTTLFVLLISLSLMLTLSGCTLLGGTLGNGADDTSDSSGDGSSTDNSGTNIDNTTPTTPDDDNTEGGENDPDNNTNPSNPDDTTGGNDGGNTGSGDNDGGNTGSGDNGGGNTGDGDNDNTDGGEDNDDPDVFVPDNTKQNTVEDTSLPHLDYSDLSYGTYNTELFYQNSYEVPVGDGNNYRLQY